jgi:hypothetical protein
MNPGYPPAAGASIIIIIIIKPAKKARGDCEIIDLT